MKITQSQVKKLVISDVPRLDPITVFMEEFPGFVGKLILECYGQSWSAYWGNMGCDLVKFIRGAHSDYIAGCLVRPGTVREIYDPEGMVAALKAEVFRQRRARDISKDSAYNMMMEIETLDVEQPYHMHNDLMVDLLGDDWNCNLPMKINPDWEYLTRIVNTVKQAMETLCTTS